MRAIIKEVKKELIMGKGRGRPGGNPDFGTKYRFNYGNDEVRSVCFSIRFTPREMEAIKKAMGDDYRAFCREMILKAVDFNAGSV
jgi:hypothetical protein